MALDIATVKGFIEVRKLINVIPPKDDYYCKSYSKYQSKSKSKSLHKTAISYVYILNILNKKL